MRPVTIAIPGLFIVGSACFMAGSLPAYSNAVGATADAVTYFIGSIFFTAASFLQLREARAPSAGPAGPEQRRNRLAAITQFAGTILFNISTLVAVARNLSVQQQDHHVWRPDVFGSTLFIVSSVYGILALGAGSGGRLPGWIAWLNLTGSLLFMAAAVAGYIRPDTGEVLDLRLDLAGTLLGALCFLLGAALMFPAGASPARSDPPARHTRPA